MLEYSYFVLWMDSWVIWSLTDSHWKQKRYDARTLTRKIRKVEGPGTVVAARAALVCPPKDMNSVKLTTMSAYVCVHMSVRIHLLRRWQTTLSWTKDCTNKAEGLWISSGIPPRSRRQRKIRTEFPVETFLYLVFILLTWFRSDFKCVKGVVSCPTPQLDPIHRQESGALIEEKVLDCKVTYGTDYRGAGSDLSVVEEIGTTVADCCTWVVAWNLHHMISRWANNLCLSISLCVNTPNCMHFTLNPESGLCFLKKTRGKVYQEPSTSHLISGDVPKWFTNWRLLF